MANVEVLRSEVARHISLRADLAGGSYVFCTEEGVKLRLTTGHGEDRVYRDSPYLSVDRARALAGALIEVADAYDREVARWQVTDLRDEPGDIDLLGLNDAD